MNQQSHSGTDFEGKIVLLYEQGELLFGQITEQDDISVLVRTKSGHALRVRQARIMLISRDSYGADKDLTAFKEELRDITLPKLSHDLFPAQFEELAKKLNIDSDLSLFALFLHLKENTNLFYSKKGRYFKRTEEEQAQFHERKQELKIRESHLSEIDSYFETKQKLSPDAQETLLRDTRSMQRGERIEDIERLLRKRFGKYDLTAIRRSLGDCLEIPDPVLDSSGLPIKFLRDGKELKFCLDDLPEATHNAFSIDEDDSKDFDDAISIEETPGGYMLGIHVSNPAFFFEKDSPYLIEAIERASSLYLPSGVVPMLPPLLSDEAFSLNTSGFKAVLSLYVSFDDKCRITSWELKAQKIKICQNLSFSKVEKEFSDPRLKILQKISQSLREEREGAEKNEDRRFFYSLQLRDDDIIAIKKDMHSPVRLMIEELMILYNRYMAVYAQNNDVAALYRNISQYTDPQSKKQSNTAYLDTKPGFHPGIGSSAYLHATSPLRRTVDIINQAQIYKKLCGEDPLFEADELKEIIPQIEKRLLFIRETMQRSERYWFLKFLEKHHLHAPLQGEIKAFNKGRMRVEILPWGKQVMISSESAVEGEQLHFIIYQIDFEKMLVSIDLIG
ncbi:MAG: RNB domain-containing ribonuclease [Candidatus Cloacimonadaceae bacterium]